MLGTIKSFFADYQNTIITFYAIASALIIVVNISSQEFVIGHDVYFHIHAAEIIKQNALLIPEMISGYWGDFLFGYPPLFHFLVAVLSTVTTISIDTLFKYSIFLLIPASILLLFLLYRPLEAKYAAITTLLYGLTLGDLLWPLYSGEYPRYLSFIFVILSVLFFDAAKKRSVKLLILSGVFGGLAMSSNMIGVIFVGGLLGYMGLRKFIETKHLLYFLPPIVSFLVSALWWLRAMYLYGYDYFYRVLTIHQKAGYSTIISIVLGVILVLIAVKRNKWPPLMAVWFILSVATIGAPFVAVPIAYYAVKLGEKYLVGLNLARAKVITTMLAILTLTLFYALTSGKMLINHSYMHQDVHTAAAWIQQNTEEDSEIIAYGAVDVTGIDFINQQVHQVTGMYRDEMLPYLTGRDTLTWFGYEWSNDPDRYLVYKELHEKLCAEYFLNVTQKHELRPTVIWINKNSSEMQSTEYYCDDFDEHRFSTLYENDAILLYGVGW